MIPLIAAAVVGLAALAVYTLAAPLADRRFNTVSNAPPYSAGSAATALHDRLFVADMHADFLLWRRDLIKRYDRGHVDLPRLIEGNVGLQVFSVVTKSPWGQNYVQNESDSDRITLLAVAEAWPPPAWTSLRERALYQARRLREWSDRGEITLIRTSADLDEHLERRASGERRPAALLAMEGMHPVEGRIANVDAFFEVGYRMMAPVHMFDNELGGSAQGSEQGGLTEFGRLAVRRMDELRVVIDLAHASERLFDDVLEMTSRPVVVSHTGIRGTCDSPRNLSDEQIRQVAATGGVIGVGFWDRAVCGTDVRDIVRAIRHVVEVAGIDHAALGSDFDGTVRTAFDVSGMPLVTEALLEDGFSESDVARIMGGNVVRVLRAALPPADTRNPQHRNSRTYGRRTQGRH